MTSVMEDVASMMETVWNMTAFEGQKTFKILISASTMKCNYNFGKFWSKILSLTKIMEGTVKNSKFWIFKIIFQSKKSDEHFQIFSN